MPARTKPGIKAPFPGFIEPELATSVDSVPSGERWIHEIKFDGYRVQIHLRDATVKVFTRRGNDWTNRFKNEPPPDEEPDDHEPERELDRSRLAKILASCLAKLAPAARDAVVLRYHQDLSYDEASAIAGDNAGTLQQRVARALPALRRCVDARLHPGSSR